MKEKQTKFCSLNLATFGFLSVVSSIFLLYFCAKITINCFVYALAGLLLCDFQFIGVRMLCSFLAIIILVFIAVIIFCNNSEWLHQMNSNVAKISRSVEKLKVVWSRLIAKRVVFQIIASIKNCNISSLIKFVKDKVQTIARLILVWACSLNLSKTILGWSKSFQGLMKVVNCKIFNSIYFASFFSVN